MKGRKFTPANADVLAHPDRRRFMDPERILDAVGVPSGAHVAEVGAGTGVFALPLARRVGERGRVYAFDVQRAMLAPLVEAAESGRWPQLVVRASEENRLPLDDRAVEHVFLIQVLHELDGLGTLRETRRVLRPDGLLHVVDWHVVPTPLGPPIEERVDETDAIRFVERAGFRFLRAFTPGEANYGLTFRLE